MSQITFIEDPEEQVDFFKDFKEEHPHMPGDVARHYYLTQVIWSSIADFVRHGRFMGDCPSLQDRIREYISDDSLPVKYGVKPSTQEMDSIFDGLANEIERILEEEYP